jgi:MFS family permease
MGHNVTVLCAARIPMSAARALAGLAAPIYLALIGFSAIELGVLFLVAGLTAAVLSGLSGPVSDRFGRKAFLIGVPLLAGLAAVIFAVTRQPVLLFVGAALGSFGRGSGAGAGTVGPYQPVESAIIAESTPARWRNASFGRLYAASSVGALIGGLLGTLVSSAHLSVAAASADYRPLFLVMAGCAIAAGLIGIAVREPDRRAARHGDGAGPGSGPATGAERRIRLPRRSLPLLVRLWVTNTVNGAAVGMFGPFLTYWFFRKFGVGPAQLGVLFAVINAVTVLSGLVAAGFARRLGLVRAIVITRIFQAVLLVPMVLAPTFWLAGAVYLVRMGVQRIALPLRQSFVLAAADPAELASVAAFSNVPSQLVTAAAPVATGYILDEVSLSLPFLVAAALQGINALLYWVFFRSTRPEEERPGRVASVAPPARK